MDKRWDEVNKSLKKYKQPDTISWLISLEERIRKLENSRG